MALPTSPYVPYAQQAALANGVPPEILLGLITQESSWIPSRLNHNSDGTFDFGITQLNSRYYPEAVSMTPQQQIDKSAQILAQNYKSTGSWDKAVAKYNPGDPGYSSKVFNYATAYGWQASTVGDAVATGAPVSAQFKPGTDGTVTGTIEQVGPIIDTISPQNPNPGGGPPAPPTIGDSVSKSITDAVTALGDKVAAAFKLNGVNWAFVAIGGFAILLTISASIQGEGAIIPLRK